MMELEWDEELARIAQRWADQCAFGHDSSRSVARFDVGQNVYETSRSKDADNAIVLRAGTNGWFDEVKDFNSREVGSYV